MNWFNIIKNPKLRVGSKVTTNLSSTSDNQPDEPCKKKLLDYQEKLKNAKGLLTNLHSELYLFGIKQGERKSKYGGLIREEVEFYRSEFGSTFDKLPEEVACKALKMLSEMSGNKTRLNKQIGDKYWCEVVREIADFETLMVFEIRLTIMTEDNTGPIVIVLKHQLSVPFDEMRANITQHSMLLDKMDWR